MKHHRIASGPIALHVVEHGDGPAVLFCHGFPDIWLGWRRQLVAVAEAGYRAVALDMRGYGESDKPAEADLYTPFSTVGDLIAVLDALAIDRATVVGHDFGATVAWSAAMMRPDRFSSVFALSVPFRTPGGPSFLEILRSRGHAGYYMFRMMRDETDAEIADAAATIPSVYYWTSGSPPEADRWDPFDPALDFLRPAPSALPAWLDPDDLAARIDAFGKGGFHGPLNWYRAIQFHHDRAGAFVGARIRQPAMFLTGAVDGLVKVAPASEESLRPSVPGLQGVVTLDGVGHWPQLEAPAAVNEALLGFLNANYAA